MAHTLERLNQILQELEVKLIELYEDLSLAGGPIAQGDIKYAIKQNLRNTEYIKGQITQLTGITAPFYITVVTGKSGRIKKLLGNQLYTLLVPPNHDANELGNWVPFDDTANGGGNVKSILQSLKLEGYAIIDIYVDGVRYQKSVSNFMNSPRNNIAIIDLLSLDDENEQLTRLFNHQDIAGLIIPDNINLHAAVKEFVGNLKVVLSNLVANNIYYLTFNNMINKPILKTQIEYLMKRNQPITNSIDMPGGDRLRNLSTGFN